MRIFAVSANGTTVYDISAIGGRDLPEHWSTFPSTTIFGREWMIGMPSTVVGARGYAESGYHPFFAPRHLPYWPPLPVYPTEDEAHADRLYGDPLYAELVPFPLGGLVWYRTGRHVE